MFEGKNMFMRILTNVSKVELDYLTSQPTALTFSISAKNGF